MPLLSCYVCVNCHILFRSNSVFSLRPHLCSPVCFNICIGEYLYFIPADDACFRYATTLFKIGKSISRKMTYVFPFKSVKFRPRSRFSSEANVSISSQITLMKFSLMNFYFPLKMVLISFRLHMLFPVYLMYLVCIYFPLESSSISAGLSFYMTAFYFPFVYFKWLHRIILVY
jgi:hypothetical protein